MSHFQKSFGSSLKTSTFPKSIKQIGGFREGLIFTKKQNTETIMTKLVEMLDMIEKTSSSTRTEYYGYVNGECDRETETFIKTNVRMLASPNLDVEIAFIRQEHRLESKIWREVKGKLRECLHEKGSSTSWVSDGTYIVIFNNNQLFFSTINMCQWTIDEIYFDQNFAIILGNHDVPNHVPRFGQRYQPRDIRYLKKEYKLGIPRVKKIPL